MPPGHREEGVLRRGRNISRRERLHPSAHLQAWQAFWQSPQSRFISDMIMSYTVCKNARDYVRWNKIKGISLLLESERSSRNEISAVVFLQERLHVDYAAKWILSDGVDLILHILESFCLFSCNAVPSQWAVPACACRCSSTRLRQPDSPTLYHHAIRLQCWIYISLFSQTLDSARERQM